MAVARHGRGVSRGQGAVEGGGWGAWGERGGFKDKARDAQSKRRGMAGAGQLGIRWGVDQTESPGCMSGMANYRVRRQAGRRAGRPCEGAHGMKRGDSRDDGRWTTPDPATLRVWGVLALVCTLLPRRIDQIAALTNEETSVRLAC